MRSCLLLFSLLLLQACSTIKLGYQQLPTLSYWWLDSTVSFSGTQSDQAKTAINQLYQWHRREALPVYAKLMQDTQQLSAGPVQADQLCKVLTEAQNQLDLLMRQAVVLAAPVAMALGPRQLSHMAKHWDSKNEAWEKEWLQGDSSERLARRLDKTLSRYSSFYGELNAEQTDLIKTQLSQSPWRAESGRRDRQRRQQDLLAALQRIQQNQLTQAQTEAQLWGVWERWLQAPDAVQQNVVQSLSQRTCENLAQLHNTSTPEQRLRASRRLRAYERDLLELIRP
ncbi:DUF6279 family lipoprotein [Limnohabitans sp.]|jgi:hypothetical protein|uniref:DUF6279 family lipoprotein n=1 Tax=Limnohabitans sp. TaxID=1907725 RepID=UPI0037C15C7F